MVTIIAGIGKSTPVEDSAGSPIYTIVDSINNAADNHTSVIFTDATLATVASVVSTSATIGSQVIETIDTTGSVLTIIRSCTGS